MCSCDTFTEPSLRIGPFDSVCREADCICHGYLTSYVSSNPTENKVNQSHVIHKVSSDVKVHLGCYKILFFMTQ